MPFLLSRGGRNISTEVQRWQYFLRKQGITQVGSIDADFGINTETATSIFQLRMGLPNTKKLDRPTLDVAETLGYKVQPNNYYQSKPADFPARPTSLSSPSNASRNRDFTCFKFMQLPRNRRPDDESIVQKGSCDGRVPDWVAEHIVTIQIPQLDFAKGYDGRFRCHKKAAPIFAALFAKWEAENLLHLIRSYEGCFVARYIRGSSPGPDGHGLKNSSDVSALSNHSFGSTFDINFVDNQRGNTPAAFGARGCIRELVESANSLNVFWGGHFGTPDGMHFEIAKLI